MYYVVIIRSTNQSMVMCT